MAVVGNTELAATKQELIAAIVQREIKTRAMLAPFFTDVSRFAVKGAKAISFPKLTSFVANDRATTVAGVPQVLTSSADKLELIHKPYVSWVVDANDEIQSTLDFQSEAARRAATAHGRRLDLEIYTELEVVGQETATTAALITRDVALEMRDLYLTNEGLMEQAVWVVSGAQETALLKIDEFKNQDIFGVNNVVRTGQLGTLYGAPVMRHNSLAAGQYFLASVEGLVYGFQRSPQIDEQKAIEYGTGAMLNAMDALFGVQGVQLGAGTAAAAESALIIKDANA